MKVEHLRHNVGVEILRGTEMSDYDIQLKPIYSGLELISVPEASKLSDHHWFNRTLCEINDSYLRIGVFDGDFHWHKHEEEDEFFYVVEGELFIDIEDAETIALKPKEGVLVPRNVMHRPRAPHGATVLMIENKTIDPKGVT